MFSFLKRNAGTDELFLVDIGTHTVKTSIVRPPSELESNPTVLSHTQHVLPESTLYGRYVHDLDRLLETVNQTLEHTVVASGVEPGSAVLGLSGGSVHYVGLTVRIHRENPESEVQEKELRTMLARVEEDTLTAAREKIGLSDEWVHLGVAITDYKVGSSFVQTPLGLTGDMIECTVLHGFWEKRVQKSIDTVAGQLGLVVDMVWETALTRALKAREQHENFVLVDIGGAVTECVLVRNRRIVKNGTGNIGADMWTERLAKELHVPFHQAEKVKVAFHEGVLDQERATKTKEILEQEISDFIHMIASLLHDFAPGEALPAVLVFSGEGSRLDIVKSKVIAYPWTQGGLFETFPQVERLKEDFLNEALYYGYTLLS